MRDITAASVVAASDRVVSCELLGEAVILDAESERYFGLNAVGASLWKLIQAPRRVGELVPALTAEYEVGPERCEDDILALLGRLDAEGLIEVRHESVA